LSGAFDADFDVLEVSGALLTGFAAGLADFGAALATDFGAGFLGTDLASTFFEGLTACAAFTLGALLAEDLAGTFFF
jgi:hypothetical protein